MQDLSRLLHAVTIRADRAADRILRAERGLSYNRFLVLYAVDEMGGPTQRALAERLGVTEPSVSRMVRALRDDGLLFTDARAGGNRRQVTLTPAGAEALHGGGAVLERRFADAVAAAGVDYDDYRATTARLLGVLGGTAGGAAEARRTAS